MSSLKVKVLNSMRRMLRAQRVLFENDIEASLKARAEIRHQYENLRGLTNEEEIQHAIDQADDATEFMLKSIIQVEKNPTTGRPVLNVKARHTIKDVEPPAEFFG